MEEINSNYKKTIENKLIRDYNVDINLLAELSGKHLSEIVKNFNFINLFRPYSNRKFNKEQIKIFMIDLKTSFNKLVVIHELKNEYDQMVPNKNSEEYRKALKLSKEESIVYQGLSNRIKSLTEEFSNPPIQNFK